MPLTLPVTRPHLTRGERDLLAAISRYCRDAGWRYGGVNGASNFTAPDRSLDADWWSYHRGGSTVLQLSTLSAFGTHTSSICSAEIGSVREAVDIACAYGLLPQDFSSAFQAAAEAAALAPRYTRRIAMRADQVEQTYVDDLAPGWQVLDAGNETTWHDVVGIAECEDDTCRNRDIIGVTCVVVLANAWAGGLAHLVSDETVQVRIPVDDADARPLPDLVGPLAEAAARVDWCEVHQVPLDGCDQPTVTPCAPRFFNLEIGERLGYVAGECGHAMALSEWRAGFRACERCIPAGAL